LIEKERSFKATAAIEAVFNKEENTPVKGKGAGVFFERYYCKVIAIWLAGILVKKNLCSLSGIQAIPGAFNYERYSAFHHTFHQVYLTNS
jgi:hypothetical protein